jgi:hypothetical protein
VQVHVRCQTGLAVAAQPNAQRASAEAALESAIEPLEDQRQALPGDELRSA